MHNKRREFLKQTAFLGLAGLSYRLFGKTNPLTQTFTEQSPGNPFSLPELPYGYDTLEPSIDKETMMLHHGKHHKAYVDNLNKALAESKVSASLEDLLKSISTHSTAVRNNAGGHYNHSLFWTLMRKPEVERKNEAQGKLYDRLIQKFDNTDNFRKMFSEKALKHFGSGWCWLMVTADKELTICTTPNQDNPLMDIAEAKGKPVLALDVWEHAYYLKYQNRRAEYIQQWWGLVNWAKAEELYLAAMAG